MSTTSDALAEAIASMESMIVNEGQQVVFEQYILKDFLITYESTYDDPCSGWEDVDAGEYADFMGDICEEGNSIMTDAYDLACERKEYSEAFM